MTHPAGRSGQLGGRADGDHPTALFPTAGAKVDDPVRVGDDVEVVLDHHHGGSGLHEPVEDAEQHANVERVQTHAGLVQHEHRAVLVPSQVRGELEALCLPAGQGGGGLAEGEVAEPQLLQELEPTAHGGQVRAGLPRLAHGEGEDLRQRVAERLPRSLVSLVPGSRRTCRLRLARCPDCRWRPRGPGAWPTAAA